MNLPIGHGSLKLFEWALRVKIKNCVPAGEGSTQRSAGEGETSPYKKIKWILGVLK